MNALASTYCGGVLCIAIGATMLSESPGAFFITIGVGLLISTIFLFLTEVIAT